MPIKIQNTLPAAKILKKENVFFITEDRASSQDIRPLKILILNLMPNKIETETQLLRLLSNTPLQTDIELMQMATHTSKNTPTDHLISFYKTFSDIKQLTFDGMIITGAPIENISFEEVDYWNELCEIFEWSKSHVYSTLHICWGAQAALYYHYGINKYKLPKKLSGVFSHNIVDKFSPLIRGFDEHFHIPHSRNTQNKYDDIYNCDDLIILADSNEAGATIISNTNGRRIFVTAHAEYDFDTLAKEYFRDVSKGINPCIPINYFPKDDPKNTPIISWRCHANLLYANWLNYYVYQQTPYNLTKINNLS